MSESSTEENTNSYYAGKEKEVMEKKAKLKVFVHSRVYLAFLSLYGTYDFVTDVLLVVDMYSVVQDATSKWNNDWDTNKYNASIPSVVAQKNAEKMIVERLSYYFLASYIVIWITLWCYMRSLDYHVGVAKYLVGNNPDVASQCVFQCCGLACYDSLWFFAASGLYMYLIQGEWYWIIVSSFGVATLTFLFLLLLYLLLVKVENADSEKKAFKISIILNVPIFNTYILCTAKDKDLEYFSENAQRKFVRYSILEDVPQIVIASLVLFEGYGSQMTLLSLLSSILYIAMGSLYGILKPYCFCCVAIDDYYFSNA
jgi:hypothetical protein